MANLLKNRKDFWNVPCNPITGWRQHVSYYVSPKVTEDKSRSLHNSNGYKSI